MLSFRNYTELETILLLVITALFLRYVIIMTKKIVYLYITHLK